MRPVAPLPLFTLAALAFAQSAPAPIVFEEIATRSGLAFVTNSCPTPNKNQPETMVSGVALFDIRQRRPPGHGRLCNRRARQALPQCVCRAEWATFHLTGTKSRPMAVGAQLRLTNNAGKVQYNRVITSTGFACSSDVRSHFGLGAAKSVREFRIIWTASYKWKEHHPTGTPPPPARLTHRSPLESMTLHFIHPWVTTGSAARRCCLGLGNRSLC